jgi:murein peptide amidase A
MTMQATTYHEVVARWRALRSRGVRVREVACVGAARTLLCVEIGDHTLPEVMLAAGVHGDEPAGPHALLELAQNDDLDPHFAYRIWPCTNPTGFDARTRESIDGTDVNRTFGRGGGSPEAKAIVMANRDRTFALALDLHEDDEASGFYCYEYGGAAIGAAVVDAIAQRGLPIDPRGCLAPDPIAEAQEIGGLSLSLLLARNATRSALTFETASAHAFAERVAAHVAAVRAALSQAIVK